MAYTSRFWENGMEGVELGITFPLSTLWFCFTPAKIFGFGGREGGK